MNIYIVYGENLYNRRGDCFLEEYYITHSDKLSKDEFEELCKRARKILRNNNKPVSAYDIKEILIREFDFKPIEIITGYEV